MELMIDPLVEQVRTLLHQRSQLGILKYGTTMSRTDLQNVDWLRHAQEEALDLSIYLQRLINDFEALHAALNANPLDVPVHNGPTSDHPDYTPTLPFPEL